MLKKIHMIHNLTIVLELTSDREIRHLWNNADYLNYYKQEKED